MPHIHLPPGKPSRHGIDWTLIIVVLSLGVMYLVPPIFREDIHDSDVGQHIWWLNHFADPTLFPNDLSFKFFSQPLFAPWGFQAVYRVLVPWMDAQLASKLIPLAVAPILVLLAYLVGRRLTGGNRSGGNIAALFAAAVGFIYLEGGFPRTYAFAIYLLCIWALLARQPLWLGISFLLAALFYPPIGVNMGLIAAVVWGMQIFRERKLPRRWFLALPGGLLALALVASVYATPLPPDIKPKATRAEAKNMAEFNHQGRSAFYDKHRFSFWVEGARSGLGMNRYLFWASLAAIALVLVCDRKRVPSIVWVVLLTSQAAFFIAHLVLFALHVPNRYMEYSELVFALMFLAVVLPWAWEKIHVHFRPDLLLKLAPYAKATLCLVSLTSAIWVCYHRLSAPVDRDLEAAFGYLRTLPKDVVIAAHPIDANDISMRTRRSSLSSAESNLAYYLGYYLQMRPRTAAEMTACFASDWAEVKPLYTQFGAKVFLVNRQRYSPISWETNFFDAYRPPFRQQALAQMEIGKEKGFVLNHPPKETILFEQGNYLVISLEAIATNASLTLQD